MADCTGLRQSVRANRITQGYSESYYKDTHKPAKTKKFKFAIPDVKSTVYNILHAKKLVKGNFKTKDEAVQNALELLGDKRVNYSL